MPLVVRATVVDIRTDTPKISDSFIVDTNVWLWLLYPPLTQNSNGNQKQQAIDYPSYFKLALAAKSKFYSSGLVFAELAHNIERTEKNIYDSNLASPLDLKDYRHDYPRQRAKVTTLINDAWSDILGFSELLKINLDDAFMQEATALFPTVGLDGYDAFTAQAAIKTRVNVITDDGDFASVPGLTVFTANARVINVAAQSGMLVVRPNDDEPSSSKSSTV